MVGKHLVRNEPFGKIIFYPGLCLLLDVGDPQIYSQLTHLTYPINVHLLITYRCNLRCPACEQRGRPVCRELTTRQWLKVIDEIAKNKAFMVAIGGGEPLVREDLFTIVGRAVEHGLTVFVTTNGTMVKQHADKILRSGLYQVEFSLDGHTPKVHAYTHQSDFYTIVDSIRFLRSHGMRVGVNHICHKKNLPYLDQFLQFCERERVNQVVLLAPKPPLPPLDESDVAHIKSVVRKHAGKTIICYDDCLAILLRTGTGCVAGRRICTIDPYGNVLACSHLSTTYGNVLMSSLKDIWANGFNSFRTKTLNEVNDACPLMK